MLALLQGPWKATAFNKKDFPDGTIIDEGFVDEHALRHAFRKACCVGKNGKKQHSVYNPSSIYKEGEIVTCESSVLPFAEAPNSITLKTVCELLAIGFAQTIEAKINKLHKVMAPYTYKKNCLHFCSRIRVTAPGKLLTLVSMEAAGKKWTESICLKEFTVGKRLYTVF